MKVHFFFAAVAACFAAVMAQAAPVAIYPFVYETPREFFASGDFTGNGRMDVVVVDKDSGKYRLGYQLAPGALSWVDCRPSGIKGVAGFNVGKLLDPKLDALAFTSADGNQITMVDAASPTAPSKPITVPFTEALGPNTVVAVNIGGEGKRPQADLFVGSMFNAPDPSQGTLVRNDGHEFPKIADMPLTGVAVRGNHLPFNPGQADLLCLLINGEKNDTFRAEDLSTGKPVSVASLANLPAGSDYAVGNFRGSPLPEFIFYKPGANQIRVCAVEETAPGKFQLSAGTPFELAHPVLRVVTLTESGVQKLLVIFGEGETAEVFSFDGVKAPVSVQTLTGTNDQFTCAASLPNGFVLFSQPAGSKFSSRYQVYSASGSTYAAGPFGSLPSLADNDNITIPDIHARIEAKTPSVQAGQMQPYTNTIPGTQVTYTMVPIPAGEFVMGSPDTEAGRKPDEGPQHKVKISAFWMGQCEVTWNEYELFMYPDQERRTRATIPTDAAGDKLADAVTHPSKPYVEMSFGMGKDGFPAISMTQHAANKYCQWLSAKTGHFYRLPTEAEWEYAARAGTTTRYFYGDDAKMLGEYAWFEENSDFKYQKVGKKKPNPWGLYDIYGNVVEWVLDQYDPEVYKADAALGEVSDPWKKATKPYPHSVRGGSWDDAADMCRSAARRGSERAWKMQDPQLPKSVWYFSDAQWVGFRIVRPLKVPPSDQMQKYWTSGVERD